MRFLVRRFRLLRMHQRYLVPVAAVSVSIFIIFTSLAFRGRKTPEVRKADSTSHFPGDRRYENPPDPAPLPEEPEDAAPPPQTPFPTMTPTPTPAPTPPPTKTAVERKQAPNKYKFSHLVVDKDHEFQKDSEGCLDRARYNLSLFIPFGLDVETHKDSDEYVLILGSGGLVGSALERRLRARGYKFLYVLSRHHHDLRLEDALEIFSQFKIKFVYFLAYEVGGAKFLQLPENQNAIRESNMKIMDNVFKWVEKKQVRFCFISSRLTADNSTYGEVKRLGEKRTLAMPHIGRVFRLWNAYGFEYPGPKSHAIPDFVFQCLTTGKLNTLTDGQEKRQFTHVDDISDALIAAMEYFDETPLEADVSDGKWLTLAEVANEVVKQVPNCVLNLSDKQAKKQGNRDPNLTSSWHQKRWQQKISLSDGIADVVKTMQEYINKSKDKPAVAFVLDCGKNLTDEKLADVTYVVQQIQTMADQLSPMKVQIMAAANEKGTQNQDFPCDVLICRGHYLRKAVKHVSANAVVVMKAKTVPTMTEMTFFQRHLLRDMMFYYAGKVYVNTSAEARGETNATTAGFVMSTNCKMQKKGPRDLHFIAASQDTWKSIKVPPKDVNVHDWLMRFVPGYVAVKFESPVWTWARKKPKVPLQHDACCTGVVATNPIKSETPVIFAGRARNNHV